MLLMGLAYIYDVIDIINSNGPYHGLCVWPIFMAVIYRYGCGKPI